MASLTDRRAALEHIGFVPVEHDADTLICARVRWHWDLFIRQSIVLRVRVFSAISVDQARKDLADWMRVAPMHDWSKVPRGFLQSRSIVDVIVVDRADDALKAWARNTVAKGFGMSGHPVVVEADGTVTHANPIWGAAYWPKIRHAIQVAATGQPAPEPLAAMGAAIGWLIMVPGVLTIVLSCCGLPLFAIPLVRISEERPQPAALPGPPGG